MLAAAVLTYNLDITFGAHTRRQYLAELQKWTKSFLGAQVFSYKMKIEKSKSLKELTTFKIGGKAQFFCTVKNEEDLLEAVSFAKKNKSPIFILGGGSNILVSDKGYKGMVIKMEMMGIDFAGDKKGNVRVTAQAGEDWDDFVEEAVQRGLYGIENLSLIPGTVGATPVQNIGAYGSEVKDTIEKVRIFDIEKGKFKDLLNSDCHFDYRDSMFKNKKGKYVIVSVTFILKKKGKVNIEYKDIKEYFASKDIKSPTLRDVRSVIIHIRKSKLPDVKVLGTAGSFFKNPFITDRNAKELKAKWPELPLYPVGADDSKMKVSLAWILDKVCGYRGKSVGNVGTYKNQALVLVNNGNATAKEIKSIAGDMVKIVKKKTGIDVEQEVENVGD